jgi:hypothetical protein
MPALSQGKRGMKPEHLSSLWRPGRSHPTIICKPVGWGPRESGFAHLELQYVHFLWR